MNTPRFYDRPEPEEDLRAGYDRLAAHLLRLGDWLTGPKAALLPAPAWDALFAEYEERLKALRKLGDALRPVTVREQAAPVESALTAEVLELFGVGETTQV